MRANRYLVAIVGVALAVSFALPGVVSAQEEKWREAYNAYQSGDYSQAEGLFREVCTEYEDAGAPWGWCHMMLGITLGQEGPSKRQEALSQLEIAKDLVTEDVLRYQTNFAIANIRLLDEQWDQALAAADDAAQFATAEQAAAVAKVKGQAYYQKQDWSDAATELEKAVAGRNADANLHAWLGRSYFELGDMDKALPELTQASQIDRTNRVGLYFAARIQFDRQNYTQAIQLAERAIQSHPRDINIRNLLGMSYLGADRFADAVQQFEVVIGERPDDATAIYNLGQAYQAQEQWARAVEQFQKAQNLFPAGSPTQGRLLYDMGIAYESLGRYEDALKAFNDAKAINDTVTIQDAIDRVQERIRRGKGGGGGGQ
jgi:tetratricopeptide (TPR) repeat protein